MVLMVMGENDSFHGIWKDAIEFQNVEHMVNVDACINQYSAREGTQIGAVAATAAAKAHEQVFPSSFTDSRRCLLNLTVDCCRLCIVIVKFYVFTCAVSIFVFVMVHSFNCKAKKVGCVCFRLFVYQENCWHFLQCGF